MPESNDRSTSGSTMPSSASTARPASPRRPARSSCTRSSSTTRSDQLMPPVKDRPSATSTVLRVHRGPRDRSRNWPTPGRGASPTSTLAEDLHAPDRRRTPRTGRRGNWVERADSRPARWPARLSFQESMEEEHPRSGFQDGGTPRCEAATPPSRRSSAVTPCSAPTPSNSSTTARALHTSRGFRARCQTGRTSRRHVYADPGGVRNLSAQSHQSLIKIKSLRQSRGTLRSDVQAIAVALIGRPTRWWRAAAQPGQGVGHRLDHSTPPGT